MPSETDTVTSIEHREGESVPGTPPASVRKELEVPRTRTSSAWVAAASGALLLLLMLVFILQNGDKVRLHFLWLSFSLPLGVALLLAGVIGALIVGLVGMGRMLQLRLVARRHRKDDRQAVDVASVRG